MATIEIYTTPTCPYCHAAKAMLNEKGADYTEITVLDPQLRDAMTERAKGRRTVPQIFIGATHVGGYDDMAALDRQGGLDPLLAQ
ncbi:glutaredoxin 3 [Devosia psychrophila]|uniref:Glutaredoxin n=1 Tax=Devosia psychrophila TaxID=728005 RepID=A0A0F5PTT2_9HYPH|nr:glutaredoxin 3 [Devosia psychrophila]KKC32097.1 glutaredoxin [Devosia psychrophila]SFD20145.1 glutaredoxin 3 [Devosia psychrophila]